MPSGKKPRDSEKFEVAFRPAAEKDLVGLHDYIAGRSGFEIASAYIARIEEACLALEIFPERGIRRDDITMGLRILGFERRVAIAFKIDKKRREVVIVRIFYGGHDYERILLGRGSP